MSEHRGFIVFGSVCAGVELALALLSLVVGWLLRDVTALHWLFIVPASLAGVAFTYIALDLRRIARTGVL